MLKICDWPQDTQAHTVIEAKVFCNFGWLPGNVKRMSNFLSFSSLTYVESSEGFGDGDICFTAMSFGLGNILCKLWDFLGDMVRFGFAVSRR